MNATAVTTPTQTSLQGYGYRRNRAVPLALPQRRTGSRTRLLVRLYLRLVGRSGR